MSEIDNLKPSEMILKLAKGIARERREQAIGEPGTAADLALWEKDATTRILAILAYLDLREEMPGMLDKRLHEGT
jgi:hypothetical protein